VVILGFPSDEGVRRNGGRPGAAAAPAEIRRALYRLTPDPERRDRFADLLAHTRDLGDVACTGDLEADQARLGRVVGAQLSAGAFPIVLGGGHETAFGHFLGYVEAGRAVTLLNWDAHTDVREPQDGRGHSGSPFRQALLHPSGRARRYLVAGLLPHSVAGAHLDFVRGRRGNQAVFASALTPARVRRLYAGLRAPALVSFDIDAVDQAQAPGASAPATGGLSAALWLEAARAAGRSPAVASCDIVETNPAFDRDQQTSRLAALTVWSILSGLCARRRG
jgi:formiminoglutamase